jgi:hypothetical protein
MLFTKVTSISNLLKHYYRRYKGILTNYSKAKNLTINPPKSAFFCKYNIRLTAEKSYKLALNLVVLNCHGLIQ